MTSTNTSYRPQATPARKPPRMAREPLAGTPAGDSSASAPKPDEEPDQTPKPNNGPKPNKAPSKLDRVEALLLAPAGASIAELVASTGWQQHSVRGAMAGALKKRGLAITSDKVDGVRRYRASKAA